MSLRFRPSLSFVLLCVLLCTLWVAGGATRADVAGQIIVRAISWSILMIAILFLPWSMPKGARPILFLLAGAILLALLQLIPLPPSIWQSLPGRHPLIDAAAISGQAQPWRPWSIVPGATLNAVSSLIVPLVTLVLVAGLPTQDQKWLPSLILAMIVTGMMIGLLQVSGAGFDNVLVNDTPGDVSGMFANRNHFALFMALGCLMSPVWAFSVGGRPSWRGLAAIGLTLLFILMILATGSRAGIGLGLLGVSLGLFIVRRPIRQWVSRYPGWVIWSSIAGLIAVVAILVSISIIENRAVSVNRVFAIDPGQDMRSRGLPTVMAMIQTYFPFGSGLGGFDPIFRMNEPFGLLKPTYFNHAHNDLLEIALDAGLPGLLLLVTALGRWAWLSVRAWRADVPVRHALPKLGSAMLLLVVVASLFDYPSRTPVVMALVIIAAFWLSDASDSQDRSALPEGGQHL